MKTAKLTASDSSLTRCRSFGTMDTPLFCIAAAVVSVADAAVDIVF